MLRRTLLVALPVVWISGAFAQAGEYEQAAKPPEKRLDSKDLQPPPPAVRVESDAVKLPDKQFEIPPDQAEPAAPPPDEPPAPPKKSKTKKAH